MSSTAFSCKRDGACRLTRLIVHTYTSPTTPTTLTYQVQPLPLSVSPTDTTPPYTTKYTPLHPLPTDAPPPYHSHLHTLPTTTLLPRPPPPSYTTSKYPPETTTTLPLSPISLNLVHYQLPPSYHPTTPLPPRYTTTKYTPSIEEPFSSRPLLGIKKWGAT